MFVLYKCPTCDEDHVLNIRTRIGYTRRKTRLKNVKITDVIDKQDFIDSIRLIIVGYINDGKSIEEIKTLLKNDCGFCYDLVDGTIEALEDHPNVKIENDRFCFIDPLKVPVESKK